ncbi:MAG: Rne/Rng family ribonuclease [Gloeobacterales cyanobacterium]
MPKQIIIAEQHRLAAVFSEDQIQELVVAQGSHQVGDIYLGVVENVLPSIDAAFVNIGNPERNGFIHVSDLGPIRLKRSIAPITELVTPQQKVLVQVMKEPTGNKGPRLTGNITLPGRFLVLMPSGRGVNLSRRIRDEDERHRLRALAVLIKPEGMGLLVRTEAEGMDEQAIIRDLEYLKKQWEKIQQKTQSTRPPALMNRDEDFIQRVLRDTYTSEVNRIVTDSSFGQKRVKQALLQWNGGRMPSGVYVEHHKEATSMLDFYRVTAAIREALKPRVDLPSGGYVVIEPTEALTVIDVNSGSFTRSATSRETVLWTNCEAATEIARQLRLRNIAGVIVIDFIDMDSMRDKMQVLEHFSKALKSDKSRPQIAQLSELGLVELTRKRQGQSIYEVFGSSCNVCDGQGIIPALPAGTGRAGTSEVPQEEETVAFAYQEFPMATGDSDFEETSGTAEVELSEHPTFRQDRRRGSSNAPGGRPSWNDRRRGSRPEPQPRSGLTTRSQRGGVERGLEVEEGRISRTTKASRQGNAAEALAPQEEKFTPQDRLENVTSAVSAEILESDGFDVKTLPDLSSEERLAKSSILSVRVPEPEEEIEQERRRRRRRAGQRFEEAKSPPLPVTVLSESPVEVVAGEPLPEVMTQEGITLKPNVEIPLDDRARRRRRSTGVSKTTAKPRERKERKEVSEELPLDTEAVEKEPKAKTVRAKRKRLPAPPRKRRKSESADEGAEAIKELTLDLQNQAPSGQDSPPEDSPAE